MRTTLLATAALLFGSLFHRPCAADPLREQAIQAQTSYDAAQRELDAAQSQLRADEAALQDNQTKLERINREIQALHANLQTAVKEALQAATTATLEERQASIKKWIDGNPTHEDESAVLEICAIDPTTIAPENLLSHIELCAKNLDAALNLVVAATTLSKEHAVLEERVAAQRKEVERKRASAELRKGQLTKTNAALILSKSSARSTSFTDRMSGVREVRCLTAFCWGGADGTEYAIEPVLDLPISMYWSVGEGGLARYVNATRLQLKLNAGVRFWIAHDLISIGVLLAEPEITQSGTFRVDGSSGQFGPQAISRPFPTVMIGMLADIVSLTFSYDQLRNTDGSGPVDPQFRDNEVLSRTVTFGVSINTFTAVRNAFGALRAAPATSEELSQ